ncbi:MAG: winged helix-turn-helix transcriptional regulator [Deltaproteobacteria bacterium]|nr:winged helix-turn-helix transcriptional regulator [Deltaproteobacteria bacterium]
MAYAEALTALADPTRRAVFEALRSGPRTVGEIAAGLPVSRPAVSQHLRVLEGAQLVSARQHGTRRIYRVDRAGLAILRGYLDSFWSDVLEAFRAEAEAQARAASEPAPKPSRARRAAPKRTRRTR